MSSARRFQSLLELTNCLGELLNLLAVDHRKVLMEQGRGIDGTSKLHRLLATSESCSRARDSRLGKFLVQLRRALPIS